MRPSSFEVPSKNFTGLEMEIFVLEAEKGCVARLEEIVEATSEAFFVAEIRAKRQNLFAIGVNGWGVGGGCHHLDLVVDCNGRAVFAEQTGLELNGWLLGSTQFGDCGHGEC